jgi:O-antigen ligase
MTHVAAVLGALGAPLVLVTGRRVLVLAGLGLIALAEAFMAVSGPAGSSPARAALGLVGLAGLALFALLFVRRPELVPLAILLAAPLRMPLDFGAAHRFYVGLPSHGEIGRLLPLYGFISAAALALAWRLVRDRASGVPELQREIAIPLAALVSFASLSVLWSSADVAAQNLLQYFLLPFAVLVAVVARSPFPAWMPRALAIVAVALACVFAAVGIVEEATHRLIFYTPSVEIGNAYSSFFRVTSLFRDPSLYGRQLVLAMAIVLTALWYRKIGILLASGLIAFLFVGLAFSYSQSSLVALAAVAVFVSVVAGDRVVRIAAAVAVVVVLAGGGAFVADKTATASTERVTSDRSRRVSLTAKVFRQHPLVGVGLGSQPRASQAVSKNGGPPTLFFSHTTPLTVAAELGLVGLVLYAALLAGAAKALLRAFRVEAALGLALAAVLVALFVHSLFYSGFFEDPMTWLVLGLTSSFLAARATAARDESTA